MSLSWGEKEEEVGRGKNASSFVRPCSSPPPSISEVGEVATALLLFSSLPPFFPRIYSTLLQVGKGIYIQGRVAARVRNRLCTYVLCIIHIEEGFFFPLPKSGVAPTFLPSKVIVITISHCLPLAFSSLTSLTSVAAKSRRRKGGGAGKKNPTAFFRVCGGGIFIPSVSPSRKAQFIPEGGSVKIPPPHSPCLHGHSVTAVTPIPQFYSPPPTHTKRAKLLHGLSPHEHFFFGGEGEISFL